MPLFDFPVFDGRGLLDPDGIDLPDEAAASLEAVRLSGLALSEDAGRIIRRERWTLDVTDGHGSVVNHVAVHTGGRRVPGEPAPSSGRGPGPDFDAETLAGRGRARGSKDLLR